MKESFDDIKLRLRQECKEQMERTLISQHDMIMKSSAVNNLYNRFRIDDEPFKKYIRNKEEAIKKILTHAWVLTPSGRVGFTIPPDDILLKHGDTIKRVFGKFNTQLYSEIIREEYSEDNCSLSCCEFVGLYLQDRLFFIYNGAVWYIEVDRKTPVHNINIEEATIADVYPVIGRFKWNGKNYQLEE